MWVLGRCLLFLAPLALAGCGPTNKQNYKEAAIGTGATIGAVGVNRAITNHCWGICSPGYLCNQESGLCELGECEPACDYGSSCGRNVQGAFVCVPEVGAAPP